MFIHHTTVRSSARRGRQIAAPSLSRCRYRAALLPAGWALYGLLSRESRTFAVLWAAPVEQTDLTETARLRPHKAFFGGSLLSKHKPPVTRWQPAAPQYRRPGLTRCHRGWQAPPQRSRWDDLKQEIHLTLRHSGAAGSGVVIQLYMHRQPSSKIYGARTTRFPIQDHLSRTCTV